ncbi:MAG: AbrB/MazE/SpoVT family DNA-binding domain-containing protein [Dechloromonas sp.]|nr:AbrB/MazE/SpoVT family DNA-binding domain-containing protein [Candidatus Dechloromonas phosphoritropha]
MKITSKGQVTILLAVREKAGRHPHSEVEFEVRDNGEVVFDHLSLPRRASVNPSLAFAARPMRPNSSA